MITDTEIISSQEETRIVIPNLNSLLFMTQLYRIPGVSLAAIQGQIVTSFDWGVKNSSLADPVTSSTVFEAASLTKPLVAYLALKLCEKGVLELDRPLPLLEENLPPITLRQILTHTAGFPTENRKAGDPLRLISLPGSCFAYSGEGFCYLSRVIEHLTNTPLASLIRELVFKPLHMEESSLVWEEKYNTQAASPHNRAGQPTEKWKPIQAIASFSLHTTASDFAKFMIAGCKAFPEMSGISHQVNDSIGWGLGWGIEMMPDGTHAIWHSGDNGTFQCLAFQNKEIGFVIMTNSANGMKIYRHIFDLLIGGYHPLFDWEQFDIRAAETLDEEFLANWWKIYGV
jgi:CubicO group peptidase (beta-lactamase class C family)